jgi:hypothetical protein
VKWIPGWLVDPNISVKVHFAFLILWALPGTVYTVGWGSSMIAWVSWMSLWALVVGHWSGLQAALADLRVKHQDESPDSGSPS